MNEQDERTVNDGAVSRREFIKDAGLLVGGAAVASTALLGASAETASAQAGPVTFELFDPTSAFEVSKLHAPRLDTLEGKTICELSNDSWQALRTFPYLRDLLKKQFPTAQIIPWTEFPTAIDSADVAAALKKAKCDAVIIGNGG